MRMHDRLSRPSGGGVAAAAALLALIAGAVGAAAPACAQERNPAARVAPAPTRVIVKFRETAAARGESQTASVEGSATAESGAAGTRADSVRRVAARARLELGNARALALGMHVMNLDSQNSAEPFDERLARLRADPEIEFAEPDYWRFPLAAPNDPLYPNQWYWQNRVDAPSAVDAETAWNTAKGSAGVVIAVLDTGVLFDHPDLGRAGAGGRLLPGYDFVTDVRIANDGSGRDPDPSDPGDWVAPGDAILFDPVFNDCLPNNVNRINSSWHGTRVTGLIGAQTDNDEGIAGGTWESWILPVRVLGKCGGYDSDIIPAMLWAGGVAVSGVPANPHPAKVLNLSLGSNAPTCPGGYRTAIESLLQRGVLVVASSGNEGGPVGTPGNCDGVLAVTGLRQAGTKVGFSNVGPKVGIGAPGGNCVNIFIGQPCLFSVDTTSNAGLTTPGTHTYTDQINANYGTSFASPIVSAVAGLMLSVNGNLRSEHLIARIRESAKPFPPPPQGVPVCHVPLGPADVQESECGCTTQTCGAGMLNAPGAVEAALRPIAAIAAPSGVSPGRVITLSGAGSGAACGHTVMQHAWSIASGSGSLSSPNAAETQVPVPALGELIVRLTVTDDAGRQDAALITLRPTSTATTAPANAGTNACPAELSPIGVLVEPETVTLLVDGTVDFDAAVVGGAADDTVTWLVNGIAGGNATFGAISAAGQYTAPAEVPSPALVTVTAIANADTRATGSAVVTVTSPPPPPAAAANPAPSGGGGGGALDLLALLMLGSAAATVRRAVRRTPQSS